MPEDSSVVWSGIAAQGVTWISTKVRTWMGNRLTASNLRKSREMRVFGFGLPQDRHVGIGVLPGGKEVLVGGAGFVELE